MRILKKTLGFGYIYGYFLTTQQTVPIDAVHRFVKHQHGSVFVWYEHDMTTSENEIREYLVIADNVPVPDGAYEYVGSTVMDAGNDVLHVYYRKIVQ